MNTKTIDDATPLIPLLYRQYGFSDAYYWGFQTPYMPLQGHADPDVCVDGDILRDLEDESPA